MATPASAAPGDLDPSFGAGGIASTDLGAEDFARDVAVDSAGRTVVLGLSEHSLSEGTVAVVRYTSTGALDLSFGGGDGIAPLELGPGSWDGARGLAIDGSDRIVVAGENANDLACSSFCNFALARLTVSGQPDPAFDGDGLVTTEACCGAWGVAIDESARIVVAGSFVVRRYLESGAPDPSFDGDGVVSVAGANGVSLDSAGRIVVADFISGTVSRLLAGGAPDPSFDGDGMTHVQIAPGSIDYPSALTVDAAGRSLLVGLTALSGEPQPRLFVLRLTAAGAPDPSFDGDGILLGGVNSWADDVTVDAGGRLLVTGYWPGLGVPGTALLRLMPDGSLDPSFAGTGFVSTPAGGDITIDVEQRIVVVGSRFVNDLDVAVARHLTAPDSSPPIPPADPPVTLPSPSPPVVAEPPAPKAHPGCRPARKRVARLVRKLKRTATKRRRAKARSRLRQARARAKRVC
jgi:uncharacterized delta-60 repeat protein